MRYLILVVAAILTTSAAGTARADGDRTEAKREFTAGQAANRAQDWANAVEHYIRANEILPHPNTINNIAVDYENLLKFREAATWYRKYLELAPDAPDAARIRQKLVDLAVHLGPVMVHSNPNGGRVLVDGEAVGSTPITLQLRGGTHRVSLEQNGRHVDKDIHTEYGEPLDLPMSAGAGTGADGTLLVYGAPEGATVFVDDQPAGTIPAQVPLAAGHHTVRVQAVGYQELVTDANVPPAGVTRVPVQLQPPGVGGNPGGAKPLLRIGYLFGASGGADVTDGSVNATFDLGIRANRYDLLSQLGKARGGTYINLAIRAALTDSALAPFIGAGYFFVTGDSTTDPSTGESTGDSGSGLMAMGGLRYAAGMVTLRATAAVGYFSASNSSSGSATKIAVPITVSLELSYGGR